MSDRPNTPVPDELAAVRAELKRLEAREVELRNLLIAHPDIRTGASWLAEVQVTQRQTTDIKEMRACHPALVEEFTFPVSTTRVVLMGISEDGEIVSARKLRSAAQ